MPTMSLETASLTLFLSRSSSLDRDALEQGFVRLQSILFQCRGVIPPKIAIQSDERLSVDAIELAINQRADRIRLPPDRLPADVDPASLQEIDSKKVRELTQRLRSSGTPPGAVDHALFRIGKELWDRAPELLSTELVEHYLDTLESTHPNLVQAVRLLPDLPGLASRLASRLASEESSIRNLPAVLEEFLAHG